MAVTWRFARYINPVLAALRDLGGSARPREVYDLVAERCAVSDSERLVKNRSGPSRFENDVAWARFYLVRSGYLESSRHGVWSLTEQGRAADALNDGQINSLLKDVHARSRSAIPVDLPNDNASTSSGASTDAPASGVTDDIEQEITRESELAAPEDVTRSYRERALEIMLSLPPAGFERLCQRLLRESGFQQVRVTGRSGDGGIDGIGVLQVNTFVSFKILFQCKRWAGAVGSPEVRNFRGAMMGRADKGLILTTGSFTADAQAEAVRDGASPVELVDGQALVTLLEQLQLGLLPRTTYEVDERFFDEFVQ
jgi:restriction system protein